MQGLHLSIDVPDLWQQDAIRALADGKSVIVDAPTGAGKTRIFEQFVESGAAARLGQSVYTVPTRALANDKWEQWKSRGWRVGIATGDLAENLDAPVLVATLETQRERILAGRPPRFLVVDEYQMLADPRRGLSYELALALPTSGTQFLLLSGSVANPNDLANWFERLGRPTEVIRATQRPVPLEEVSFELLPRVPDTIRGFWARLAAAAFAANLCPLLIFAPRRADAEKIAAKAVTGLPPSQPLHLPDAKQALGKELASLVERRVAFHHSGLPYAARARWIEPLARNGHLRVIVATTGLAAGINFSVRSVLVADTTLHDGAFQRTLRPDELLQMFGRAGRRGLDTAGAVIVARNSPRLFDAAPRHLRRVADVDWPTVIRLMETATQSGQPPLEYATAACARFFTADPIHFASSPSGPPPLAPSTPNPFDPTRREVLDADLQWRPFKHFTRAQLPIRDCLIFHKDRWVPAVSRPNVIDLIPMGRTCKLQKNPPRYGVEVHIAKSYDEINYFYIFCIDKNIPKNTLEINTLDFIKKYFELELRDKYPGFECLEMVHRGPILAARMDVSAWKVDCFHSGSGLGLMDPPQRVVRLERETDYANFAPEPGSAAHAWRALGLVDREGRPTARGRIFSRFQGGEGLMIAAGLEDETYPTDELVCHLANLRGGLRFALLEPGGSERLAVAAHAVYGHRDYAGVLESGLNPGYGENTWEALERFRRTGRLVGTEAGPGDIERARLEWLSLLRHIIATEGIDDPRFQELQSAAAVHTQVAKKSSGTHQPLPAEYRVPAPPAPTPVWFEKS